MKPIQSSLDNPRLRLAAIAMNRNDIPQAERLLKALPARSPDRRAGDPHARRGRDRDAAATTTPSSLLERCLELAPGFAPARYQLAVVLHRRNEP